MAECEKIQKCQFFNDKMENMPPTTPKMKESYCASDKQSCARYIVSTAGHSVPPDLFPHQSERARVILGRA